MIKLKDIFKPLHKQDAEQRSKAQDEAVIARNSLQEIGAACMADPKFARYKESFQTFERLTIDRVRRYQNPDPVKYAMMISNMISELNVYKDLIDLVESDAKKVTRG